MSILGTDNIALTQESANEASVEASLSFLSGQESTYTENLLDDWFAQMLHLDRNKKKTCKTHRDNLERLMKHAAVPPWKLRKQHVVKFFESRVVPETGEPLAASTVAGYCSSWRSFQSFMLELDRINEIVRAFNVRPEEFITEENAIPIKKAKSNWKPISWALTDEHIDKIDEQFRYEISVAYKTKSKSLLPLMRDRVMFHIAIHFALRISELVTLQLDDFRPHHDPELAEKLGRWGTLTVTGKNDTTGTIPMREMSIHDLLEWYVTNVRQKILLRRNSKKDSGLCVYDDKEYVVANLLFPTERGGIVHPNTFRSRLNKIASQVNLPKKLKTHTLRHTGCTLMVPLYTPEIAQKYMRHRWLSTTLGYYHPNPLEAGNEVNAAFEGLFDDEE